MSYETERDILLVIFLAVVALGLVIGAQAWAAGARSLKVAGATLRFPRGQGRSCRARASTKANLPKQSKNWGEVCRSPI